MTTIPGAAKVLKMLHTWPMVTVDAWPAENSQTFGCKLVGVRFPPRPYQLRRSQDTKEGEQRTPEGECRTGRVALPAPFQIRYLLSRHSALRGASDSKLCQFCVTRFGTREGSVMRTVVTIAINLGFMLVLFIGTAIAQERDGMMSGRMYMMGWPMMLVMGLFWILLLILMVLAILWLIKQLRG